MPAWAAEDDRGRAGDDAENLVRGGVEVVVGEDPVQPGTEPTVAGEEFFARGCRLGVVDVVVDEHRRREFGIAPASLKL
jgi:hypothetical protein